MLVATQWTLKPAPHLKGSVWYGGLEAHWNYLRHAVFWTFSAAVQYTKSGTHTSFQNDYEAWGWQTQVRWILMCLNRFSTHRLRPVKCTTTLPSILYNGVFFLPKSDISSCEHIVSYLRQVALWIMVSTVPGSGLSPVVNSTTRDKFRKFPFQASLCWKYPTKFTAQSVHWHMPSANIRRNSGHDIYIPQQAYKNMDTHVVSKS